MSAPARAVVALAALTVALSLVLGVGAARAQVAHGALDDRAGVVPRSARPGLEQALTALATDHQVAMEVVVLRSLAGRSIEATGADEAARWASSIPVGQGVVLVLALDDRQSRLEVGDRLRARLPDARAAYILDSSRPWLRQRDHAGAIAHVIAEVRAAASGQAAPTEDPTGESGGPRPAAGQTGAPPRSTAGSSSSGAEGPIVVGLVALLALGALGAGVAVVRRRGRVVVDGRGHHAGRSFVLDWLIGCGMVLGVILLVVVSFASSRSSGGSSSSSSSWGGGGGSSGTGGGGFSGGGASSSW